MVRPKARALAALGSSLALLAAVGLISCGSAVSSKAAADVRLQGTGDSFQFPIIRNGSKRIAPLMRTCRSTINRPAAAA
jgi:hypothetical protein